MHAFKLGISSLNASFTEMTVPVSTKKAEKTDVIPESYEAWKERMLKRAYAELQQLEHQGT